MNSHWSNPLLLCGKASSQTDVLGPCWAYIKPSTGKLGMWLVAQLNVSGYAQESECEWICTAELGALYWSPGLRKFPIYAQKGRRSFIVKSTPKLVNLAAQVNHWHPSEKFGMCM